MGALALRGNPAVTVNPSQELAPGLAVGDIPGIVSKVLALSGNGAAQQSWSTVLNAFGPVLGLAVGGPVAIEDAGIIYQLFENGLVLSSQDTGTRALVGEFARAWAQGDNAAQLGLPTSDMFNLGDKHLRVDFQRGYISYNPDNGTVEIHTK